MMLAALMLDTLMVESLQRVFGADLALEEVGSTTVITPGVLLDASDVPPYRELPD